MRASGLPTTGEPGDSDEFALPEDGRHCPTCRSDISQQYPTLRQVNFGPRGR
ncbi:hypothetical protein [Streptomyces avermitilis]|uniref:Uncharacterized protein n=1 Tax=Streptomyces avermitilis TaxID=33903 RepID=A0A4D4MGT3_STRAX|nr:hypothetical protein [Streptomyces avermitilis]GDY70875.1 hypothetical protein SAV31267_003600 [Streptomyces avermitilis]